MEAQRTFENVCGRERESQREKMLEKVGEFERERENQKE